MLNKFLLGVWNIGIIENSIENILNGQPGNIKWVKHKYKDRFFADPFLYDFDDKNYYILVEEFPFYTNVGFISLLTVNRKTMKLIGKERWIEESWHLSYPFVYNGKIIPEAYRSGKVYAYDINDVDTKEKKIIFNSGLIDQTFLKYGEYEWIFATDAEDALSGLKIFYRKSGELEWIPHKSNPVKIDIKAARPGGHFFERNGVLYRPVQDSEERYGRRIRLMKIDILTPEEFKETEVMSFSSDKYPPYNKGLHTFNVEKNFIVVDGYKEYHSFFIKPMCLKLPRVMRFFGERK